MILPQLEQQNLYDLLAVDDFENGPWLTEHGPPGAVDWIPTYDAAIAVRPAVFVCPSDSSKPCAEKDSDGVVCGQSHFYAPGSCAATGNYVLSNGTQGPPGSDYANVKFGNTGAFAYVRQFTAADFRDGLSNTFFVGEAVDVHTRDGSVVWSLGYRYSLFRTTKNPMNTPPGLGIVSNVYGRKLNGAFQSRHPGGTLFAFGDGHVSFLSENIQQVTYESLATRAGGEVIDASEL
jgi:prepilin-type processing-associated H-X9-DG protein